MRTDYNPHVHHEALPDVLDELATMLEHWSRNRAHGRTPHHLRAAIMNTMQEALKLGQAAEPHHSMGAGGRVH